MFYLTWLGMVLGTLSAGTLAQYWVPGVSSLKLVAGAFKPVINDCLLNSHRKDTEFFPGLNSKGKLIFFLFVCAMT
jgi:hypothetical protein